MTSSIRVANRFLAAKDARLDRRVMSRVNASLIRAGLDGNTRFRTPSEALARANKVLSDYGLEWDEVINSFQLKQPVGDMSDSFRLYQIRTTRSPRPPSVTPPSRSFGTR